VVFPLPGVPVTAKTRGGTMLTPMHAHYYIHLKIQQHVVMIRR
jgi:hypothetical protein